MNKMLNNWSIVILFIPILFVFSCQKPTKTIEVDVCYYGGSSAGVVGALSSKRLGYSSAIVEPTNHLGGLSSSGLSSTDIGNKHAVIGIARDFYRQVGAYFNQFEAWNLVPSKAEAVFNRYADESQAQIFKNYRLNKVIKDSLKIVSIYIESDNQEMVEIKAKYFVDCSYEGDLMAQAGVSFTIGREDNKQYDETYNGVQLLHEHQFPDSISPYKIPNDPKSGLLWGINPESVKPNGTGDKKIQAYNFRMCLTNKPENRIEFSKPDNYDTNTYALVSRLAWHNYNKKGKVSVSDFMIINNMPEGKTDCNHRGGFSLDFIGGNHDYPLADYKTRAKIWKAHEDYIKGFLYYLANHPTLPEPLRVSAAEYGYCKDEFTDNGGFPHQLYVREARRMVGEMVMTQHHCVGEEIVADAVALAAYTMDSHNCDRHVVDGFVKNEGNVEVGGFPPYPLSYRCLIPKKGECDNLIVPVCLSASHIAYGSIRMEPVFMVLAQVAALAIDQAMHNGGNLYKMDTKAINNRFASDPQLNGSKPDILVDNADSAYVSFTGNWVAKQFFMKNYKNDLMYTNDSLSPNGTSLTVTLPITETGKYKTMIYCPNAKKHPLSDSVGVLIIASGVDSLINVGFDSYKGGWFDAGTYNYSANSKNTLTIAAQAKSKFNLIFDAVLLVPTK